MSSPPALFQSNHPQHPSISLIEITKREQPLCLWLGLSPNVVNDVKTAVWILHTSTCHCQSSHQQEKLKGNFLTALTFTGTRKDQNQMASESNNRPFKICFSPFYTKLEICHAKLSVTVPDINCISVSQNYYYCCQRGCFTKEKGTAGGSPRITVASAIISSEQDI